MIGYLCPALGPTVAREVNVTLELLITLGTEVSAARQKVAELYSPLRVTTEIAKLPCVHLAPGETFDLREGRRALLEFRFSRR